MQAKFIINGSDVEGDVPGLQSVATAMGTPCARNAAIGGTCVSRK